MPHVIVKLWPGVSDDRKSALSDAILRDVTMILGQSEASVSIAFEDVPPEEWAARVYGPDISRNWDRLTKVPAYGPGPDQ